MLLRIAVRPSRPSLSKKCFPRDCRKPGLPVRRIELLMAQDAVYLPHCLHSLGRDVPLDRNGLAAVR